MLTQFKFVDEQDTIHTVYYAWAMQQLDAEEVGEGAPHSIWKLREMQQQGVRALIWLMILFSFQYYQATILLSNLCVRWDEKITSADCVSA